MKKKNKTYYGSKTSRPSEKKSLNKELDATIQSYFDTKKFLRDHNITISTIALNCNIHTAIDVDKFAKNVVLKEDGIVCIKYGNRNGIITNRSIVVLKKKKKPSAKNFYNQTTVLIKPNDDPDRNYINIKVFRNGSLQATGCRDMEEFNYVATLLINTLKRGRDIHDRHGNVKHLNFIDNFDNIGIYDIKIRLINSNFKLNFKIDRKKLAKLLKQNHGPKTKDKEIGPVEYKYEPTGGHSCVNIKFRYDENNRPSIFVFQTGSIIITGAKTLNQIIVAYKFIKKILDKYYDEIKIIELDYKSVRLAIAKFFKNKNQIKKDLNSVVD